MDSTENIPYPGEGLEAGYLLWLKPGMAGPASGGQYAGQFLLKFCRQACLTRLVSSSMVSFR
ncbi:hypothetical protein DRQ21_00425 [Candidatus Fermentibacteria bacterium]|nr:MAG: hypothetical protein DRQ21_00425 [Candidatus Fermentibacteria bacterium]